MALGVYCDESESSGPRIFTLGGWASVPTAWASFEVKWREMLKCAGPTEIRAFHMVDVAALRPRSGECKGWKRQQRRDLIKRATDILLDKNVMAIPYAVAATIEVDVLRKYLPSWQPTTVDLYKLCFQSVMYQVGTHGVEQSISFVMDRNRAVEEDGGVLKAFYAAKDIVNEGVEDGKFRGIAFEDDRVLTQLQAADYLAYTVRRGILTKRTDVKQRRERDEYQRLKELPHFLRCYGRRFVENLAAAIPQYRDKSLFELLMLVDAPED